MSIELSVVIPAYNEESRIVDSIERVCAFFDASHKNGEVIVSSDGSTDRTDERVGEWIRRNPSKPARLLTSKPNTGKGFAARQGILAANGEYILITDTDLSAPIKEVDKLIGALKEGRDVAIGSRAVREQGCDVQQSPRRWFAGRVFNWIVRSTMLPGLWDTQCGFKCFRREAAKKLFSIQKEDGFIFDVEILFLARRLGYKIKEVPVMWRESGSSHVRLARDSTAMLRALSNIKKRKYPIS